MPRQLKNNGTWLPVPWEEFIGKDASHGASWNAGWEDGGTQSTFSILVNWEDGPTVEPSILGHAYFNSVTGNLDRTLPVRHPYKSDHFAERIISAQPVCWDEKLQQWFGNNMAISTGAPLSQYVYWLITIGFAKPKYRVLSDAQVDAIYGAPRREWMRFCEIDAPPHMTTFSSEGHGWIWSAGPNPLAGQALLAPLGVAVYGAEWHVKWRRLPRRGLMAQGGAGEKLNQNLIACLNHVHNGATDLWGQEGNASTGVLRLVSAHAVPVPSPFDPVVQGLGSTDYNVMVDLDMVFSEWRPPAGDTSNLGWNLAPSSRDNKWWLVQTLATGDRLFPMADLTTAFQLSLT